MKRILTILCAVVLVAASAFAKGEKQTVVFDVDLHCQGCINKIEKNIAFEKGVKDLVCDLEKKTVMVTFDPTKTSIDKLQKAFEAIGKPASVHQEKKACQGQCPHHQQGQGCQHAQGQGCSHDHQAGGCQHQHTDANSGATTKH